MDAYASASRLSKLAGGGGNHGTPSISETIFMTSGPDHVAARKAHAKGRSSRSVETCGSQHRASSEVNIKDQRKEVTGFVASHCTHQSIINVIGNNLSCVFYLHKLEKIRIQVKSSSIAIH